MSHQHDETLEGLVFRRYFPLFVAKIYALAALSAVFFDRLLRTGELWWLCAVVISLVSAVLLGMNYYAHSVTVYDSFIVIRSGFLSVSTIVIPLWQAEVTTQQSLLGRALNYGTIQQSWHGRDIEIKGIACLKHFQQAVLKRQQLLLSQMMVQPYIVAQQHPYILSNERVA